MKDRPILMSAPMVRALLAGTKTQTRRIAKVTAEGCKPGYITPIAGFVPRKIAEHAAYCPYGVPGDRLWVRETFSGPHCMEKSPGRSAIPPAKWGRSSRIWYWADGDPVDGDWTRPRPSIHMPRWASRITLEIDSVRVERLQEISDSDAFAEGIQQVTNEGIRSDGTARGTYRALWDSLNSPGSWDANPWVWVLTFNRVQP